MTAWYINRSAGLVAWALLSASMVLGLLLSSKALGKRVKPNWLQDLHRGLSGLAVVFVGVHVAGAIGDNFIPFNATQVLVPFTSTWRPWAIAWGVVTMYLLIAVEGTSLLRKHLSKSAWRKVHYLSFPLFLTATAHGITAGTEMGNTLGIAVAAMVTAAIAGLTALRIIDEIDKAKHPVPPRVPARVPTRAPAPAPAAAVAAPPAPPQPPVATPPPPPAPRHAEGETGRRVPARPHSQSPYDLPQPPTGPPPGPGHRPRVISTVRAS